MNRRKRKISKTIIYFRKQIKHINSQNNKPWDKLILKSGNIIRKILIININKKSLKESILVNKSKLFKLIGYKRANIKPIKSAITIL